MGGRLSVAGLSASPVWVGEAGDGEGGRAEAGPQMPSRAGGGGGARIPRCCEVGRAQRDWPGFDPASFLAPFSFSLWKTSPIKGEKKLALGSVCTVTLESQSVHLSIKVSKTKGALPLLLQTSLLLLIPALLLLSFLTVGSLLGGDGRDGGRRWGERQVGLGIVVVIGVGVRGGWRRRRRGQVRAGWRLS